MIEGRTEVKLFLGSECWTLQSMLTKKKLKGYQRFQKVPGSQMFNIPWNELL